MIIHFREGIGDDFVIFLKFNKNLVVIGAPALQLWIIYALIFFSKYFPTLTSNSVNILLLHNLITTNFWNLISWVRLRTMCICYKIKNSSLSPLFFFFSIFKYNTISFIILPTFRQFTPLNLYNEVRVNLYIHY